MEGTSFSGLLLPSTQVGYAGTATVSPSLTSPESNASTPSTLQSIGNFRDLLYSPMTPQAAQTPGTSFATPPSSAGHVTMEKRMEALEKKLQMVVDKLPNASHPTPENVGLHMRPSRKCDVETSRAVRNAYCAISSADEEADAKWLLAEPFSSAHNTDVTRKVIQQVRHTYGATCYVEDEMRKSAKAYFRTIRDREKRQMDGKMQTHRVQNKQRKRKRAKQARRLATIEKMVEWSDRRKQRCRDVFAITAVHSSEDSDEREDEQNEMPFGAKKRYSKRLQWQSDILQNYKKVLDSKHADKLSAKSKMMSACTSRGNVVSQRACPQGLPEWAHK